MRDQLATKASIRCEVVEKAINFLHQNQLESGEFLSYKSRDFSVTGNEEYDSSPFPTALILHSISFSQCVKEKEMTKKALDFLLAEMESFGIWRYWTKQHPYHIAIPPDLDDIACVSSILTRHRMKFPNNIPILLSNRNNKGVFYTWLAPGNRIPKNLKHFYIILKLALRPHKLYAFWKFTESHYNDIDAIVNANVINYLGNRQEAKPVIDYLIGIIEKNMEENCDKWHLNPLNLYYFISKNYFSGFNQFGKVKDMILGRINQMQNEKGIWGENHLETAIAICVHHNFNVQTVQLSENINHLMSQQLSKGCWQTFPLYYGGPKKYYGWGSRELTTAFCIEAISRYK